MEIKRLSKLSSIVIVNKDFKIGDTVLNMADDKIIQVVKEEDVYFIEYIPREKIQIYESGYDKIEETAPTQQKTDSKLEECRQTVLRTDIFNGGKYAGMTLGAICDTDIEYAYMFLEKSTNSFIKDKFQYILDNRGV